ncbi:hypothetical protein [Spongiimicrobium salis]|uniref:hypothetical protein n=1 Tax=Spongiimicrobium salis TaxID=1667022 RepID=UPI00374DA251
MKKINLILPLLFLLLLCNLCSAQTKLEKVSFLIGTWKIENKNTFEVWEQKDSHLKGHSYKEVANEKRILETLSIKKAKNMLIYEALVPNQNQGKAIPFTLNTELTDLISFENLKHDFPKKIQYKKIDATKILVNVLGPENQGFSYYLIKQ